MGKSPAVTDVTDPSRVLATMAELNAERAQRRFILYSRIMMV